MLCNKCGKDLTKKETVVAEINDNNICDSCWSISYANKLNKEAYDINIKTIPVCHRIEADLFTIMFVNIYKIEASKANVKNIIVKGKSGTLKTTTAYCYLKQVWENGNIGKLITFSEALTCVEFCCKYDGYLILDDVFSTQSNKELFDIVEHRLLKGYYTYITTNVIDFNYFGEKISNRLNKNYLVIMSK